MIKSIKFKVKDVKSCPITKDVISEYKMYYNRCSDWIKNNLTTVTIGEMSKFLQETTGKNVTYITMGLSEEWKDKPLYHLFYGKYHTKNADNLLYYFIKAKKLDEYDGNMLNLSDTYYRQFGYFKLVVSNYRTKIRTLNLNVKRKRVDVDSTSEDIESQVIYEIVKRNLNTISDWENYISYIEDVENPNIDNINRYKLLQNYFCECEEDIKNKIESLSIEQLKDFGGCLMKPHINSMTINIQDFKIEEIENSLGFLLQLPLNRKYHQIELYGNRQVKKGTKENYKTLVDIINTHGENIVFTIENNELYVVFSYEYELKKKDINFEKIVGIDVNFKHALFVTSETDNNQLCCYINLYKHILEHDEFTSLLTDSERKDYEEIAKTVTFCPFEYQLLFTRFDKNSKANVKEKALSNILYDLQKKLKSQNKIKEYIYVSCVNKLRAKFVSYFILKEKYFEKQKEYDIQMGFVDDSTESKESMDKRRLEYPFRNTPVANELLAKLNNVQQDINGCLKNIINYAYKVFELNGYNVVALENLENANFEKKQIIPTIKSLLKYHKLEMQNINDIKVNDTIKKYIENDYYQLITNENNQIVNANFSSKGINKLKYANFFNLLMKSLHFASIKDEFILLSNNGNTNIALVPHEYTSQMDSIDHCIYMVQNDKGNLVKAHKTKVRTKQEKHINGLNADFNAATNIKYIVENEKWRNIFCKLPKKLEYNTPVLDVTKKGQSNIIKTLKNLNATKILDVKK